MENGVSLRRTLSNVPIHGLESLVGTSVRGTTLKDWAVVWTVKCFCHARGTMLVFHAAFAGCVHALVLKIMVVNGAGVCRVFVCRCPLRCRVEGLFDTVLGVGSSAREDAAAFVVSLLAHSLSFSPRPGG